MTDLPRILIVDDEARMRQLLKLYLSSEFRVEEAASGREALELWQDQPFDLILLDLMLPDLDGWSVCRRIRDKDDDIPIIMLTARTEIEDRVTGLDIGADDYVTKPFDPRELVARVRARLRRRGDLEDQDAIIKLPGLTVDLNRRSVEVGGEHVPLTPKEYDLLVELSRRPGRVFSREQLMHDVWGHEFLGETRTVDSHIKNLRDKLSRSPTSVTIETVWGVGYKLEVKA